MDYASKFYIRSSQSESRESQFCANLFGSIVSRFDASDNDVLAFAVRSYIKIDPNNSGWVQVLYLAVYSVLLMCVTLLAAWPALTRLPKSA